MTNSLIEAWFKPSYKMLSEYEKSLENLEKAVEEDDMESTKIYSLETTQYFLRLVNDSQSFIREAFALPQFTEDKEEYKREHSRYVERLMIAADKTIDPLHN